MNPADYEAAILQVGFSTIQPIGTQKQIEVIVFDGQEWSPGAKAFIKVTGIALKICLVANWYLVQLVPSRRFASATDWMHSVIFPSASRVLARAKIDANFNLAFSSARRTESRVGW